MSDASFAGTLLELARRDAQAFQRRAGDPELHDSPAGFHAQQVIEKAPKAVPSRSGVAFRRTHDLAELLDLLADSGLPTPPHADRLDELNPYAADDRYGLIEPTGLDRAATGRMLADVLGWASGFVSGVGQPTDGPGSSA